MTSLENKELVSALMAVAASNSEAAKQQCSLAAAIRDQVRAIDALIDHNCAVIDNLVDEPSEDSDSDSLGFLNDV